MGDFCELVADFWVVGILYCWRGLMSQMSLWKEVR